MCARRCSNQRSLRSGHFDLGTLLTIEIVSSLLRNNYFQSNQNFFDFHKMYSLFLQKLGSLVGRSFLSVIDFKTVFCITLRDASMRHRSDWTKESLIFV